MNYDVSYNINVVSANATKSLNAFVKACNKLTGAGSSVNKFLADYQTFLNKVNNLTTKIPVLDIKTDTAKGKLSKIIRQLNEIHRLCKTIPAVNVPGGTGNQNVKTKSTVVSNKRRSGSTAFPANTSYRVLGPTMIDSGGVGVVDMMKGMGVAYGIAGAGQLIGSVVGQSVEYENIMQTAKNILQTHDRRGNFNTRFEEMEKIVRQVGVQTKYTAPEVAGAAKYLAMAGMNVEDINRAISPVADIALVGDTDLATTADLMTNIVTAYNIPTQQLRHISDIMTMTFTRTNTTITDIAEAFKYSASLFSTAGIPFETAAAALGVLGDAGIKGSQAGTTMRTIMNNLLKPTKSQETHWNELGISRMDKDGNLRPINEIFGDLAAKGAVAEDYFKLFRLTAAQGANALGTHVEKWNSVIEDNFLSEGTVAKLAYAKQNTLQGLWYKLTSTITEGGLQAFEDLQQPLKDFMRETIEQLGSKDSLKFIKDLANTLFSLVKFIKTFTTTLISLYKTFDRVIIMWLKFQLGAKAVVGTLRIFRSILNIGQYAIAFSKHIVSMGQSISKFKVLLRLMRIEFVKSMNVMGPDGKVHKNYFQGFMGAMKHAGPLKGVSSLGLALLGGNVGGNLFEPGSTGETLGMLGGGALGLLIPQMFGAGPIGVILATISALALLSAGIVNYVKEIKKARSANQEWIDSMKVLGTDIADISSPDNLMMTNLRLYTDSLKEQNIQLELSIGLLKRYSLSKNEAEQAKEVQTKFGSSAYYDTVKHLFDRHWSEHIFGPTPAKWKEVVEAAGGEVFYDNGGKFRLGSLVYDFTAENLVRPFAKLVGGDMNNPVFKDIESYLLSSMKHVTNQKQYEEVVAAARKKIPEEKMLPKNFSVYGIKDLTFAEFMAQPDANYELEQNVESLIKAYDKMKLLFVDNPLMYDALSVVNAFIPGGVFNPNDGVGWRNYIGNVLADPSQYGYNDIRVAEQNMANVYSLLQELYTGLVAGHPLKNFVKNILDDGVWNLLGGAITPLANRQYIPVIEEDSDDPLNTNNYASSYSTSAAPKQVIIKIENLLNVESVDMSDPNNQAVISQIQGMVTGALVDAANQGSEILGYS